MTTPSPPQIMPTVSYALLDDLFTSLRQRCAPKELLALLEETGLDAVPNDRSRVNHDQIVHLYQRVASSTGDEMLGLWSRPIRPGALKQLCTFVRGASALSTALFRFSSFWNLLLDDFDVVFESDEIALRLILVPRGDQPVQRFGHMLLLKLAHGIASWLTGRELPVLRADFCFSKPSFAADYTVLFPAVVHFDAGFSSISFDRKLGDLSVARTEADMHDFLLRAPRDWIFTSFREHALPLRVRELLLLSTCMDLRLGDAALALNVTSRTLIRRLDRDGTSFQVIKDDLRRDIAIRDLALGVKTTEAISQDVGFASVANFHRAFKRWTGETPRTYRRALRD